MTDNLPPPPEVDPNETTEVAPGVYVIGDRRVPLVPNIGIVLGGDAALVVDTGMGPDNGRRVLDVASRLAGGRKLILTLTHFHPEHGFGAAGLQRRGDHPLQQRPA
ncbi:MAG: MBL fold metallo-hydrolase [Pseudomonas sp.]